MHSIIQKTNYPLITFLFEIVKKFKLIINNITSEALLYCFKGLRVNYIDSLFYFNGEGTFNDWLLGYSLSLLEFSSFLINLKKYYSSLVNFLLGDSFFLFIPMFFSEITILLLSYFSLSALSLLLP